MRQRGSIIKRLDAQGNFVVGHADIKTTFNTYGHLMPQAKKEAAAKLEKSLFGGDLPGSGTQLVPKTDVQEENERIN